jgi:hypothetical protein
MPLPGVPPARPREAEITVAVTRIPVPPLEATVVSRTPVLLRRPDVMETPTPAATPVLAAMATGAPPTTGLPPAEPVTVEAIQREVTVPITGIRPGATAPITMVEATVVEGSMPPRLAGQTATSTQRGFIVVASGESHRTNRSPILLVVVVLGRFSDGCSGEFLDLTSAFFIQTLFILANLLVITEKSR